MFELLKLGLVALATHLRVDNLTSSCDVLRHALGALRLPSSAWLAKLVHRVGELPFWKFKLGGLEATLSTH